MRMASVHCGSHDRIDPYAPGGDASSEVHECSEPSTRRPLQLCTLAGREFGDHSTNVLRVENREERMQDNGAAKLAFDTILGIRYIGIRV